MRVRSDSQQYPLALKFIMRTSIFVMKGYNFSQFSPTRRLRKFLKSHFKRSGLKVIDLQFITRLFLLILRFKGTRVVNRAYSSVNGVSLENTSTVYCLRRTTMLSGMVGVASPPFTLIQWRSCSGWETRPVM